MWALAVEAPDADVGAACFVVDNQGDSSVLNAVKMQIRVDGFAVSDKSDWLPPATIEGTPLGEHEIRVPVGSHQVEAMAFTANVD